MIIKPAKYKKVRKTVSLRVSEDVYGCDECRKEIKPNPAKVTRLDMTVFRDSGEAEHRQLCSWKCAIANLKKVKCDYFVTLPYVHFDEKNDKLNVKGLLSLFK